MPGIENPESATTGNNNTQQVQIAGNSFFGGVNIQVSQQHVLVLMAEVQKRQNEMKQIEMLDEKDLKHRILEQDHLLSNTGKYEEQVAALFDLGSTYYFLHRKTKKAEDLDKGLDYLNKIKDLSQLRKIDKVYFLNIRGMIHQGISELKNNDEQFSNRSLQDYQDALKELNTLHGEIKSVLDKTEKNSDSYKEIYKAERELYHETARLKNNIGNIYVYLQCKPKIGAVFIEEAIKIEEEVKGCLRSENFFWNLSDAYLWYEIELKYNQSPINEEVKDGRLYLYFIDNALWYSGKSRCGKIDKERIESNMLPSSFSIIRDVLLDPFKKRELSDSNKQEIFNITSKKGYTPFAESDKANLMKIVRNCYSQCEKYLFSQDQVATTIKNCLQHLSGKVEDSKEPNYEFFRTRVTNNRTHKK